MTLYWLLAAALTLGLDQASKAAALARSPRVSARRGPRVRVVRNPALGLGLVREPVLLLVLWAGATVGIIALLYAFPPFQEPAARVGLGVSLGGAAGNVLDRLVRGGVIDFIDLRVWPPFNLADIAILSGALVALYSMV